MSSTDPDAAERRKPDLFTRIVREGDRTDRLLFAAFIGMNVYGLALIPFRAKLLVDWTFVNIFLTGGNFSVVTLTARNPENWPFIAMVVLIAALSTVKFLPLYFLMGKRWGSALFETLFASHKPFWFRRMEAFLRRHPGISMAIAFIPFSPVSAVIVVIAAGISKARGWSIAAYTFVFAVLLKCFYVSLGLQFGTEVLSVLRVIDRYMLWVTLALIGYIFLMGFIKERRRRSADAPPSDREVDHRP